MINFLPINFIKPQAQAKTIAKIPFRGNLKQDTFEKRGVSFKGAECEFGNWCKKNNFSPEKINTIINNPKNALGKGNFNTVFKIPDCEEYVLRISNEELKDAQKVDWSEANFIDTEDKNISINIGQAVGKYETKDKKIQIEILKKQQGEPIGVKPKLVIQESKLGGLKEGEVPYGALSRKKKYASTLHKVANLPVSSYEKLIEEYQIAHKAGYCFDYQNSNNLLVDKANKKINFVDMSKADKIKKPVYEELLYSLMNAEYYDEYINDQSIEYEKRYATYEDNKKIVEKFITAMKNKGVKFNTKELNEIYFAFNVCFNPAFQRAIGVGDIREIEGQLKKMKLL